MNRALLVLCAAVSSLSCSQPPPKLVSPIIKTDFVCGDPVVVSRGT